MHVNLPSYLRYLSTQVRSCTVEEGGKEGEAGGHGISPSLVGTLVCVPAATLKTHRRACLVSSVLLTMSTGPCLRTPYLLAARPLTWVKQLNPLCMTWGCELAASSGRGLAVICGVDATCFRQWQREGLDAAYRTRGLVCLPCSPGCFLSRCRRCLCCHTRLADDSDG